MEEKTVETNVTDKEKVDVNTVVLKRPLEIDGEKINELKLNFDGMSGADILKIDKELRKEGLLFDDLWNQRVILKLASRGTGIIEDELLRLHPGDYLELTMRTRNFFIKW